MLGVLRDGLARALEHVRRVVAHQVVQAAVVLAAELAVESTELVQPDARLVAVADAELEHVQVFGQRAARGEVVPDVEQLEDQLARGGDVARVALAAGQGLLVLAAGRLLPERQRLPVQAVEVPDQAVAAGSPGLERYVATRRAAARERGLELPRRRPRRLARRRSMAISRRALGVVPLPLRLARAASSGHGSTSREPTGSRKFCLYWIQSHTTRKCARSTGAVARGVQHGRQHRARRRRAFGPRRRSSGVRSSMYISARPRCAGRAGCRLPMPARSGFREWRPPNRRP